MNKFVIITPSYNNENWVDVYFDSIACQTYQNYKVVYINDNSTDNTENEILFRIKTNEKFHYIKNQKNKGALQNYITGFENYADDDDILVNLDGDDWLATPTVLEQLNNYYIEHDCWITYGKMLVYSGDENLTEACPQNTPYDPFVHKYQFYRRDAWRASHLRTFKKFLFKMIHKSDLISKIDNNLYWHASDLAFMYPMMEMSPIDKIGVSPFPTYVYNSSKQNESRTRERESAVNIKFEEEIRNKKIYNRESKREDLSGKKLPQINVIGDYKERNSIPTKFSFVYNRTEGDFDLTLIQDADVLKFISGEIKISHGPLVADIHEPPYLFNQSDVYKKTYEHYNLFDKILTNNKELLTLPNSIFRNSGYEVVLNKNVHKQTYPILQDNSLMRIYEKKNKHISFITSHKAFTPGHVFRLECLKQIIEKKCNVDVFGVGIREIVGKIEALKDYRFSIAIENGKCDNYFTEKILDCFLTGTIPIYHGCPNIANFFNSNGMIVFESIDDLLNIVYNLTEKDYNDKLEAVKYNFDQAYYWWMDNDRFFDRYISKLII